MIKVENNILITLEDNTTISMTKTEAETLYSALGVALNKSHPQIHNPNNLWFNTSPNMMIRDCVGQSAKGAA